MKVIIVFELRNREYDNAILLKCALEDKGYEVEIVNKQLMFKWRYQNAILIIPNCYNTANYEYYNYSLNTRNNFVINLQIEQVLSEKNEENGFANPKGKAKLPIHCCWGQDTYNRLLNNEISEEHLRITGAPHLDFSRNEFKDYWYSKDEVAKMYNLPVDKKWILYISSFSYVNNKEVVELVQKDFGGEKASHIKEFEKLSTNSHEVTLNWLEKLVQDNEDIIVIYRSHPAEKQHGRLHEIQNNFQGRFFNISELNIKQWLQISDQVITWFSTSIVESYAANKMCHILRPFKIPKEIDAKIYHGAKKVIQSYEQLNKVVNEQKHIEVSNDEVFPIDKKVIQNYYSIEKKPSFQKVVELVEELNSKKKYDIEHRYSLERIKYITLNNIILKFYIKKCYFFLYRTVGFRINNQSLRKRFAVEALEHEADNYQFYESDEKRKATLLKKIIGKIK